MKEAAQVWQDWAQAIIMPCWGAARGWGRGSTTPLICLLGSQSVSERQRELVWSKSFQLAMRVTTGHHYCPHLMLDSQSV